MTHDKQNAQASVSSKKDKQPYQKPELTEYGKVRDLTSGPTGPNADAGGFGKRT